jgi:hypothetical protein
MKPILGIEGKSEIAERLTAILLAVLVAMVLWIAPAFPWAVGTCPLTQGFWKNHPDDWPANFALTIGGKTLLEPALLNILETAPSGGNAALILAHQLIAAELNIANGSDPGAISGTIADALTLLGASCGMSLATCNVAASSTTGQSMVNDAAILDNFNEGKLTPICMPPQY